MKHQRLRGPVSRHLIPSALTIPTEATFPSSLREVFPPSRRFFFRRAPIRRDYLSGPSCDSPRDLHHTRARRTHAATRPPTHARSFCLSSSLSRENFSKENDTTDCRSRISKRVTRKIPCLSNYSGYGTVSRASENNTEHDKFLCNNDRWRSNSRITSMANN